MTLPAKWDDIKNTSSGEFLEGTHGTDIHPDEDDSFLHVSHTHCSECDESLNITQHFWGGGIICIPCTDKKFPNWNKRQ